MGGEGSCEVLLGEMSFQPSREDGGCLCRSELPRKVTESVGG